MQRTLTSLLLFLLGIALSGVAGAQDNPWWQAEWSYRKPITVQTPATVGGDPGRSSVLVRLHSGNFAFDGMAADGADLRFINGDGRTILNHQIEQFDASTGLATIWVDVPALRAGSPQMIWMYYGNPAAPANASAQLAFDPDYTAVMHFAEAEGAPRDSTAYNNHARNALERVQDGVVGRGLRTSGEPMVLPSSPSLQTVEGAALTVSAWIRPEQIGPDQAIYARRDGVASLLVGLDAGVPFVAVNGRRAVGGSALAAGTSAHIALVADSGQMVLYVDGREAVRLDAAVPALNSDTLIGGDAVAVAADATAPVVTAAAGFTGMIDELRISKVARPLALLQSDHASQGPDSSLLVFGEDEQTQGVSHFGFILKAMPVDAWVVVALLGLMLLFSWAIMIAKSRYFGTVAKANAGFTEHYRKIAGAPVATLQDLERRGTIGKDVVADSTLWRLYRMAMDEVKGRQHGQPGLSASAITAIRATLDAEVIRESERMSRRMNWLSTTIEGAPYVGLFGTVIGIMLVFVVAAMAGAVDINSVAPGMAAALLCTAAGLGVAIPALFGYNWLVSRSESIAADMAVFVDEFTARLAEEFDRDAVGSVQA